MILTLKHTGEPIDVDWTSIMDWKPLQSGTSILISRYPETSLEESVWLDVEESIDEINDNEFDL